MTIYKSIALIEDYYKWQKKFGFDGSGVDDATKKLLEVAKKYQKIQEIVANNENDGMIGRLVREVIEDGNDR